MIRGFIFRAGRSRRPSRLVSMESGRALTVSADSVLVVTVDKDTDHFHFTLGRRDGRRYCFAIPPREAIDLTAYIGFLVVPRAVVFTARGSVDRVVAEFVRTAHFAQDLAGFSQSQQR